jgi:hypothetical protein
MAESKGKDMLLRKKMTPLLYRKLSKEALSETKEIYVEDQGVDYQFHEDGKVLIMLRDFNDGPSVKRANNLVEALYG